MKTLRLFALLDQLRLAHRPVSSEVLAGRLGVSQRTIYRDIASLLAMGAPIRGESGMGYQLEKGYFLPPLQFDRDEMVAIMLGLRLISARDGAGLKDAAERVSGKLAGTMGADRGELFRALPMLAVTRQRAGDELAARWADLLRRAIRQRRIIQLNYRNLDERESLRRVHPLGLTIFDEAWLLTGWCELREDFRNFRLDRITSAIETGETFPLQPGRRFRDYLVQL